MVDFCIFIQPDADPSSTGTNSAADAINLLQLNLPCQVINHVDCVYLHKYPIAVGIETKQPSGMKDEAELQVGTWHVAQWRLLSNLVAKAGGSLNGLPFLPAIIVQGHQWSFAATTQEGSNTILWIEQSFGTTTSVGGIYSVVWGIQRIARWAEDVYWPWFKKNALGL
jgi:hypothetical protein